MLSLGFGKRYQATGDRQVRNEVTTCHDRSDGKLATGIGKAGGFRRSNALRTSIIGHRSSVIPADRPATMLCWLNIGIGSQAGKAYVRSSRS